MDAILDAVQDLPNEERGAYLDRACEGDSTLRRAIEHLLQSEEEPPAGFLENSALEDLAREISVLRAERHYGKVYRAFTLGQVVDEGKAVAKYADGVLELTLPKKAAVTAKRLSIN